MQIVDGAERAEVTPGPGAITEAHNTGDHPHGAIRVTGTMLGEATAEYCLTSLPYKCADSASLTILVEPDGWEDARVAGVDDVYRVELDWQTKLVEIFRDGETEAFARTCCLASLDSWSVDVRLPVMENDEVHFYDSEGRDMNRPMSCQPRYCGGMRPGGLDPGDVRWDPAGDNFSLGLRVADDSVVARLTSTGPFAPATASFDYCVRYESYGCGTTTCARSTYLGAPNDEVPDWVTYLPSSVYQATSNCPSYGTVTLSVKDVTPRSSTGTPSSRRPFTRTFSPSSRPRRPEPSRRRGCTAPIRTCPTRSRRAWRPWRIASRSCSRGAIPTSHTSGLATRTISTITRHPGWRGKPWMGERDG